MRSVGATSVLLEGVVLEVAVVAARPVTDWHLIWIMAPIPGSLSMLIVAVPFARTLPLLTIGVSVRAASVSSLIVVIVSVRLTPVSSSIVVV